MTTLPADDASLALPAAANFLRPAPERVVLGTSDDAEILPGAVRSEFAQVLMQDLVGAYAKPADVEEWGWVASSASFENPVNGQNGIWEFCLNLRGELTDIPEKLKPVINAAREQAIAYLLVSHTA